jgi:hypothetical protein
MAKGTVALFRGPLIDFEFDMHAVDEGWIADVSEILIISIHPHNAIAWKQMMTVFWDDTPCSILETERPASSLVYY